MEVDVANPKHLTGTIKGPDDTPYSNGVFHIDIIITPDYPFSPPKMKFITKGRGHLSVERPCVILTHYTSLAPEY